MSTPANIIMKEAEVEQTAAEAMGLTKSLTVKEFLAGSASKTPVFIFARGRMSRVGHIRWPETDPWVVCPDENGGFGISYCVHYGTRLWTR